MSTVASASRSTLVMDYETTYGSNPSPKIGVKLPIVTVTGLNAAEPQTQNPTLGCSNRNPQMPVFGEKGGTPTITFLMDCTSIMYWMKCLLGDPSTVDNGDGTYTHTYKIGNSIPSFLLDKEFVDETLYYLYNGLVAGGFSFSVNRGDAGLTVTMNLLGGGYESKSASPYDAAPNDVSRPDDWTFKPDATFEEGGSSNDDIVDFTINFTNNAELVMGINGAGKATNKGLATPQVSGTVTVAFTDDSLLLKARNRTESSLELILTDATHTPNHSISFLIPELKYAPTNPDITGSGAVYYTLPWLGYYENSSEASALVVAITNNVPSAAQTTSSTSTSTTTAP